MSPAGSGRATGRLGLAALLLVVAVAGGGCAPSCQNMCDKLDRCGLLDATATPAECATSCSRELGATKDTDVGAEDFKDFAAERSCIGASSCEEIAAGRCMDPALFPFAAGS